jgi:hypothetical protein
LTIAVDNGKHNFYVVAVAHGASDPTPAVWTWTVDTVAPPAVHKRTRCGTAGWPSRGGR